MITAQEFRDLTRNGLWKQNTSLSQLLGLCPLLAVSTNLVNGTMLSLATIIVMVLANVGIASLRNFIPHEIRIPVFILIIASLVTVVDLLFDAFLHDLYLVLGIFIPLITTNCLVLARVEAYAAKNTVTGSTVDAVMMGLGLLWTLALLGALREFLGAGTLFAAMDLVFDGANAWRLLPADYPGFLLAILPPGGFILLGFMIAGKNWLDARALQRERARARAAVPTGA